MGAMVLLLHELPDGSAHLDWMLQRPDKSSGLLTFRLNIGDLPIVPPGGGPRSIPAERLADHRAVYLDYTGPVGGPLSGTDAVDRGHVRRLRRGTCTILTETADLIELEARFEGEEPGRWRGRPALLDSGWQPPPNPLWSFSLVSPA
jgi:hypothetical protein